jgi:hypothetical protein
MLIVLVLGNFVQAQAIEKVFEIPRSIEGPGYTTALQEIFIEKSKFKFSNENGPVWHWSCG